MADSASVEFEDSDVIEIIPAEEYDTHRVSNVWNLKGWSWLAHSLAR